MATMKINALELTKELVKFIKKYAKDMSGVIIGLSGGLDSAVVTSLCVKAVGKENVLALMMPERDSSKKHLKDAKDLAKALGIKTKKIVITSLVRKMGAYKLFFFKWVPFKKLREKLTVKANEYYKEKSGELPFLASLKGYRYEKYARPLMQDNAYYRIKHRIRMVLLYLYAEKANRLVVGAANKTEARIGYFVKFGCDHSTDIMPILNLYKTQVIELAKYLGIPKKIIEKAPSPDLIPGITDEQAIGISYEKLDLVLLALENGKKDKEIIKNVKVSKKTLNNIKDMIKGSEHMKRIYVPK